MISVALYQPDIAQNVGSILRTAVAFGVEVHLIEPMGFVWNEQKMRRAGMDYLERARVTRHASWQAFTASAHYQRLVLLTTKGATPLQQFTPQDGDCYLFGSEGAGVPEEVHQQVDERIVIPMVAGERSINLAQSCGITLFNVMRDLAILP